jgi:hypothetical protein
MINVCCDGYANYPDLIIMHCLHVLKCYSVLHESAPLLYVNFYIYLKSILKIKSEENDMISCVHQ